MPDPVVLVFEGVLLMAVFVMAVFVLAEVPRFRWGVPPVF
jgi:hypothetical protein